MPMTHRPSAFVKAAAAAALSLLLVVAAVPGAPPEEPAKPDQQPGQPGQQPDGKPAEALPEVLKEEPAAPVQVSEDAKPLLAKMREAYAKAGGIQMSGTWTTEYDVDGEKGKETTEFTSSYAAPNKFRHETKDELLFGSTGEKSYALVKNKYLTGEAPKERMAVADLPETSAALLKTKNPSLLLAVTTDETPFLADEATAIAKGEDVTVDGTAFPSLRVETKDGLDVTVLVDPATNLMRRWSVDLKDALVQRGREQVAMAVMTADYASVKAEAPSADAFAWAPPEGARDAAKIAANPGDAHALLGKPAPPFDLEGLDGKRVTLAGLKGNVVVLEFWASWCGPCVVGLPMVDKATQARKAKGVKVYAINKGEGRDEVEKFVKESNLGIPVLLDVAEEACGAYGADGIPQTVVIGKDGMVKKVMLGVHSEEEVAAAIDAVLGGK